MNGYAALANSIRSALLDIERVVNRIIELREKARFIGDVAYWDAVALNLQGFYSGMERIFEDIARTVEQNVPSSPTWHNDILTQMSNEIKETRPAVILPSTKTLLIEFLNFRHLVRNVYAFNLRSSRLDELAKDLPDCFVAVQNDLLKFAQFLESV